MSGWDGSELARRRDRRDRAGQEMGESIRKNERERERERKRKGKVRERGWQAVWEQS